MWGMSHPGLVTMARYANDYNVPITMHLMEATYDLEICAADYGKRPLEVLEEIGALDARFLLVHGVQLNDLDLRLMVQHEIAMSHCMAANLYLGSGIAPITKMHPSLPVSLGTDGAASNNSQNMIELLKLTALVHKGVHHDPSIISARRILEMATCEGAQALGLQDGIGCLAPGYLADLFVVNTNLPTATPVNDIMATMVYSCDQENVQTVIIDGKVIMDERKILSVNEDEIISKVCKIAKRIIKEL
jgi:5-methylthioadenosine/S-adenosylhomocysteine deaminase